MKPFINCYGSFNLFRLTITLVFSILIQPVMSQHAFFDTVVVKYTRLTAGYPLEMIYLQTSKGIYETGEDLWFKAYLLNVQTLQLTGLSQTLYLQMIGEQDGKVVWQEKYPVENSIVDGHVYIPEDLDEGDYYLEAYTRHSFHADSTAMNSIRKIKIVKNISHLNFNKVVAMPSDSFRFVIFPEGGNLVADLPARLAYKATDGHGYPVDVAGVLYANDAPLLEFKSVHDGMGVVVFIPQKGRRYEIRLTNGHIFPLPEIHLQGIAMQLVKRNDEYLEFSVSQSDGLPARIICLIGQMRGMVCCIATGGLKENLKIRIPLKEFSMQGIASFTLFDDNMLPVAERLAYVHPQKKLHITAELDQQGYKTREKATIKIKVTDENGQPAVAHLGVSVYDRLYTNPADPVDILTHCHLTTQIKGKIYNPQSYFDENNPDRAKAMDLLLLTQGWRRYVWNSVNLQPGGSKVLTDEILGMQIIKNRKLKNTEQMIQISDSSGDSELIMADTTGFFSVTVELMKTLRGGYIYFKPMLSKLSEIELEIYNSFRAIPNIRNMKPTFYPFVNPNNITREERIRLPAVSPDSVILLSEMTITGKEGNHFRDKFLGSLNEFAQMNFVGPWVCECHPNYLNDYIEGYTMHNSWQNSPRGERLKPINGKKYRITKYEQSKSGVGVVVDWKDVVYKEPKYSDEELLKMNNISYIKGYYGHREFYQPDEADMRLSITDVRNTLSWAPIVQTDTNGEATVSFYCSDVNAGFIGKIEGVSREGLLGVCKFDFRVKKP